MSGMRCSTKAKIKKLIVAIISTAIVISFMPDNMLEAFAMKLNDNTSVTGELSEELTYQTISASPGDDAAEIITLDGLMPTNATINVQNSDNFSKDNLCAYDITVTDSNGEDFQPQNDSPIKVEITNTAIGAAALQAKKLRLWHISDDGIRDEIKNFSIINDSIIFETKGFSVFEVDNGVPPLRTYYFEMPDDPFENTDYKPYYFPTSSPDGSGSYKMICQQTIKNGEKPVFPQLPADITSQYTFVGWFIYENGTLSDTPFDFNIAEEVTENEELTLRAVFRSCVYAIFHDQYNGASQKFPVTATRRGDLVSGNAVDVYGDTVNESADVFIGDLSVSYDDENHDENEPIQMAFKGWTIVPDQYQTISEIKNYVDNYAQIIPTDTIKISRTTRLYPVFEPIRWLEFNTNQDGPGENANSYVGATYKPPLYFPAEEGFSFEGQSAPVCAGYSFDGWYTEDGVKVTDSDLNLVSGLSTSKLEVRNNRLFFKNVAGQPKTIQVDLYAKWIPVTSKYTIVIWKQKVTDSPDLAAEDKSWVFERSIMLSTQTGNSISVANEYKNYGGNTITVNENGVQRTYDFKGFSYDTEKNALEPSTKTVSGDGKTILNVYYKRNSHTFTFKDGNTIVHRVTALYGSDISGIWSFTGSNGVSYPKTNQNTSWKPTGSSNYTARITQMLLMPDENITFDHTTSNNTKRKFHYYVEALPDSENTRPYNGRQFIPYNDNLETVNHDFNRIFYNDDFFELEGFTRFAIATANNTDVTNLIGENTEWKNSWNSELYFYYTRNSYGAEFIDSFNNEKLCADQTILFEQKLKSFVPDDPTPPEGYEFTGWYADQACSTPVAFTEEQAEYYRSRGMNYQEYIIMPSHALRVYAGWQTQWFKIEIDPNGGVLTGSQATWFWEPYNGDPIEEYKSATRNYEADVNGEYYYTLRNREYYGLGEEWDPAEDTTYKNQVINDHCTRGAFYSTDISLATSATRYKEADGAYRYLGWFEVDPETGRETPFNFGTRVLKNTYLRLHWKQLGTYYIKYNAGDGTIDMHDSNEQDFEFLDADDYTDHADIVVTRVAKAPNGMVFVGWKIRNDPSGIIYYPGQSFQFDSSFATALSEMDDNGQVVTKRTIILDAIYRELSNATIIYDANGGEVDSRALTHGGGQNSSRPPVVHTEGTDHPLTTKYAISGNQLIVSDLMNNSAVRLADGVGFSNAGYTFVGWSTTPSGEDGKFFRADSINCYVDINEPLVLYAQWEVRVYFDKNNINAPDNTIGWGGDWTGSGYYWSESQQKYYITLILGETLEQPIYTPKSNNEEEMFRYWSLRKQNTSGVMEAPFDFDTPITQALVDQYATIYTDSSGAAKKQLTLFGCWDVPIRIPIHIVDTTNAEWVKHDDWLKEGISYITLRNEEIEFITPENALEYADAVKVSGKKYAFACTAGNGTNDYLNVTDERTITSIKYDAEDMKVKVKYASDDTWHIFDTSDDTPEAVYLVYYSTEKQVPISYKKISIEGGMTNVSPLSSSAPTQAVITDSVYTLGSSVTYPLAWATSSNYNPNYYSFSVGNLNAADSSELRIITDYSDNDTNRPLLQLQNTWNGFSYSVDGIEQHNMGYDLQFYVIYYEERPTVVNLTEKTISLPEDIGKEFNYTITINKIEHSSVTRSYHYKNGNNFIAITNNNSYRPVTTNSDTDTVGSPYSITLSDGQTESFVLLYSEPSSHITKDYTSTGRTIRVNGLSYYVYYQDVTTTHIAQYVNIEQASESGYVTENDAASGDHIYNSSYEATSVAEPVTITYINKRQIPKQLHVAISRNGIITHNDELRTDNSDIYEHTFGDTWDLSAVDPYQLINDSTERYVFAFTIAGSENNENIVTPKVGSSGMTSLSFGEISNSDNGFYFNGDNTKLLGSNEVYYVYYERPTIRYMLISPKTGELMQIDPLSKNGEAFKRNGTDIMQNELLPVSMSSELLISQINTPGNPSFLIPDLLDHNGKNSVLDLSQIGVKDADGNIRRYDNEQIYLNYTDNGLKYHFTSTDAAQDFYDELVVYAIYRIRGYSLTLNKEVLGDTSGGTSEYSFTISSDVLGDGEYFIGGYGDAETITASGNAINLNVHSGDSVTIYGLLQGNYTITENTTGSFEVSAKLNGNDVAMNGKSVFAHIDTDTILDIINLYPIPVTGVAGTGNVYLIAVILMLATLTLRHTLNRKGAYIREVSPI